MDSKKKNQITLNLENTFKRALLIKKFSIKKLNYHFELSLP